MSVILDSAKAESRLVFIKKILPKKAYCGLSAQGRQATSHSAERRSSKPLTKFISGQLPLSDKCLKSQEDLQSSDMDFTIDGQASLDSDVFYPRTSNSALPNAATLAAFTPDIHLSKMASTTREVKSFRLNKRELFTANLHISLTTTESLLLQQLVLSHRRICSKEELILAINRNPSNYTGLEMCLSRLQDKFNNAYGERLFRSVRNRGYCLVQDVKATPPMSTGRK